MTRQNFREDNEEFLFQEEMIENQKRREKNKWESKILAEKRRNEWINRKNNININSSFSSSFNSIKSSKSLNNSINTSSTITTLPTLNEINKYFNIKLNKEKNVFKNSNQQRGRINPIIRKNNIYGKSKPFELI
ncbi:hypothetical protein ACQ4LE_003522 [Meloidogyne hapla]